MSQSHARLPRSRRVLALLLPLTLLLTGCTNAVYFYQTDKISFTAEGRPDASSPVSANLGIKQRVALIVPSGLDRVSRPQESENDAADQHSEKGEDDVDPGGNATDEDESSEVAFTEVSAPRTFPTGRGVPPRPANARRAERDTTDPEGTDAGADALNVISYFNFTKQPSPNQPGNWANDRFTIETAFITGAAAKRATDGGESVAVAEAFVSASTSPPAKRFAFAAVTHILETLREAKKSAEPPLATEIESALRALDALALTIEPPADSFPRLIFNLDDRRITSRPVTPALTTDGTFASSSDVVSYAAALNSTLNELDRALALQKAGGQVEIDLPPNTDLAELRETRAQQLENIYDAFFLTTEFRTVSSLFTRMLG